MISKSIIRAIIAQAKLTYKDLVLEMFIDNLSDGYSYNDNKINHVLEMLIDPDNIVKTDDIDMDYITQNFNKFIYRYEEYLIKDITLKEVNPIQSIISVRYKYIERTNEDKDINYKNGLCNIDFLDNPQVLKKS